MALARVVDIEGSGPRDPGAAMAVNEDGEVAGSVSGGCVEGAVVTEALGDRSAAGDRRHRHLRLQRRRAFAVGLTCGGTIHLFLEPLDWWIGVRRRCATPSGPHRPAALATVVDGPGVGAKLLARRRASAAGRHPRRPRPRPGRRPATPRPSWPPAPRPCATTAPHGEARQDEVTVFIESFAPPPRMLIFGAVDFTAALVRVAKVLGYHVTVCDAREVFATTARFPLADEVVVDWPHRLLERVGADLGPRDAVCVLTHDHKFDVPAIVAALGTDVGYLGAMGSRRTHRASGPSGCATRASTDAELGRAAWPRSASTSAPARRRRRPSRSAPRSSPSAPGRAAPSLAGGTGPIHR